MLNYWSKVFLSICMILVIIYIVFSSYFQRKNMYSRQILYAKQQGLSKELDRRKIELGHFLFFEEKLSVNQTKSCGSCHNPELFFTDGYRLALGAYGDKGSFNTPSILNSIFFYSLNWKDSGLNDFSSQAMRPLFSHRHIEMGMNANDNESLSQIFKMEKYKKHELIQRPENQNWSFILSCISEYESILISRNSRFDLFMRTKDSSLLNQEEQKGMHLFYSEELACCSCHGGIDFNKLDFSENNFSYSYDNPKERLRIPGLRNVTATHPYMHDGFTHKLSEAIHAHIQDTINPYNMRYLIRFLQTLTDSTVLNNPVFKKP